ncbi:hypothetical protein [Cellvibrio sp. OA-2007]|uniref:hypothetical protein n=1 Tax=Cellvibrio sp. OA-2007 TaxID=529823 RepID=UPI000780366F|nr:hypothetical protein [Cellvibrio sp. OA-2007]
MKHVFLLVAVFVITFPAAAKENSDWSASYAEQAVEYQKMNVALHCGYSADRWHTDYEGHKLFAGALGKDAADAENKVREIAIRQCRDAWTYAEQGVLQNQENLNRNCGLTGAIWHSDKKNHFAWAMNQTPYMIAIHDQKRRTLLALCNR